MAAELTNYVLQERPIQPMIDLGIMQNTLATITAGNKEALQKTSELKTAIANLDLNEAEDGYKEGLYNEIEKTIDDNAIEGNAYYALDDIIKKQGDIASNPGLLGRVKAQQAYKTFQAQVDARAQKGDISFDTAEWAKEKNPYHYEDKYKVDENGNQILNNEGNPIVIGGTDWTPEIIPVQDIDLNKVYSIASQYLKPKNSQWEKTVFLDANGNEYNHWIPGTTITTLNTVTGKKSEITREMAENAINMAINANPEIEASIKQSFEVAKWKYDKGDKDNNLAYDSLGNVKSYKSYKNDLIDPYINQMVRCEVQSSTNWNQAGMKLSYEAKSKTNLPGQGMDVMAMINNAESAMGHPILLDKDMWGTSIAKINEGKSRLALMAGITINSVPKTYNDYIKLLDNKEFKTDDDRKLVYKQAKAFYDMYGSQIKVNDDMANSDSQMDAAMLVRQYLDNNIPLDQLEGTNPHLKQYKDMYSTFVKGMFGDIGGNNSSDIIKFVPKNINDVVSTSDARKRLEDLGIRIENNEIILDRDHANAIYAFTSLMNGAKGDFYRGNDKITYGFWGRIAGPGTIQTGFGATDEQKQQISKTNQQMLFDDGLDRPNDIFKRSMAIYEALNSVTQDDLVKKLKNNENQILVGTGNLGVYKVEDAYWQQILNEQGESKIKTMEKNSKDSFLSMIRGNNFVDAEVYQVQKDEDGGYYYVELNRDQKLAIQNELINMDNSKINGNLSYVQGYEFKQGINYPHQLTTAKDGQPPTFEKIELIFGTNQGDKMLDALNDTDVIKSGKELMGAYINGSSITVGKMGDSYYTLEGLANPQDLRYTDSYVLKIGNDVHATVNTSQGISLINAYRTLIQDRGSIDFGNTIEQENKAMEDYCRSHPNIYNIYKTVFNSDSEALRLIYQVLSE